MTLGESPEDVARALHNWRGPGKQQRHFGKRGRGPWTNNTVLRVFGAVDLVTKSCPTLSTP